MSWTGDTEADECEVIATTIQRLHVEGLPYCDVAALVRVRAGVAGTWRDLPQARLRLSDDQGGIDALDARSGGTDAEGAVSVRELKRILQFAEGALHCVERRPTPSLLPILRSQQQGEILALLLGDPELELSLTEISQRTGAPHSSVYRGFHDTVTSRPMLKLDLPSRQ